MADRGKKFCKNCGKQISDIAVICPLCGAQVEQIEYAPRAADSAVEYEYEYEEEASSGRSRWVAFFLCLFLGWLGIHRFYTGKVGTGIVYIFTFGLFTIGWIADLALIAGGGFTDNEGLKLLN